MGALRRLLVLLPLVLRVVAVVVMTRLETRVARVVVAAIQVLAVALERRVRGTTAATATGKRAVVVVARVPQAQTLAPYQPMRVVTVATV